MFRFLKTYIMDKLFKKMKYVSKLVSGSTQNHVALSSFMSLTMIHFPVVVSCKSYILSLSYFNAEHDGKKGPTHSSVTLILIFPLNIDRKHPEPQLLASLYKFLVEHLILRCTSCSTFHMHVILLQCCTFVFNAAHCTFLL